MNERRELPIAGIGGTNRITPTAAEPTPMAAATPPPGKSLRDPRYHDICQFFGTYPDSQGWAPAVGDWVWLPQGNDVRLVVDVEPPSSDGENKNGRPRLQVLAERPADAAWVDGDECVWLPTLAQLRELLLDNFGSTGFFTSAFTGTTYWYVGELSGMQVENMTPLSEGSSPEEAAIKALLMRFQR